MISIKEIKIERFREAKGLAQCPLGGRPVVEVGLDPGSSNPHPGAGRLPRLFSAGMLTKHVKTCQLNSDCETLEGHVTVPEKHPDACKAVGQTQARCVRGQ